MIHKFHSTLFDLYLQHAQNLNFMLVTCDLNLLKLDAISSTRGVAIFVVFVVLSCVLRVTELFNNVSYCQKNINYREEKDM